MDVDDDEDGKSLTHRAEICGVVVPESPLQSYNKRMQGSGSLPFVFSGPGPRQRVGGSQIGRYQRSVVLRAQLSLRFLQSRNTGLQVPFCR